MPRNIEVPEHELPDVKQSPTTTPPAINNGPTIIKRRRTTKAPINRLRTDLFEENATTTTDELIMSDEATTIKETTTLRADQMDEQTHEAITQTISDENTTVAI